jgi:hypothetical protein
MAVPFVRYGLSDGSGPWRPEALVSAWLYRGWSWLGMWNPAISGWPGQAQQCCGEQDDGGDYDRDGDRDKRRSPVGGHGRGVMCDGQDRHVVPPTASLAVPGLIRKERIAGGDDHVSIPKADVVGLHHDAA